MDTILNSAKEVLGRATVSVLDSTRFVRNILDAKPSDSKLTDAQFVLKVIEVGLRNIREKEMSLADGFALYLKSKQHLRPDSIRDIRCIGNRLLRIKPEFGGRNFSELSTSECEEWLNAAFHTNPQFNKARAMLHGLFEFALRREWCDKNPIKRIERRKIVEKEIQPLKLAETKRLIKNAQRESPIYTVVAALLIYTGIRPPPHLARHRHRRKNNHSPLAMLKDGRRPPSGNPSRLEQAFDCPQIRKLFPYMPDGLATPLAQDPRQFGISRTLGSRRSAPYLRKLSRKKLRRLAAPATQYGAS